MSPLIRLEGVSLAYGTRSLLDCVEFTLAPAERVCLVGRNGEGKSTLMRVLTGEQSADDGSIWLKPGLRIGLLTQELPAADGCSVGEYVTGGLAAEHALIDEYFHLVNSGLDAGDLQKLEALQHRLEAGDGWRLQQRVQATLERLGLDSEQPLAELSGGWRRRAALGRALVADPDVLLLDEPTNHLDIPAIEWLEEQIVGFRGGLILITHDRSFLDRVATRVIELDRGRLTSWGGNYSEFLEKKEKFLEEEARHNAEFDKKLAQEERWIRQGIKARRTRNEGRVRALKQLREQRSQRRELTGRAELNVDESQLSGKRVIEARGVCYRFDDRPLIEHFSTRILRGDRVGVIGSNGAGKTTLLRLLLGELEPQAGTMRLGTKLEIAYFDQLREQIEPEKSLIDNVAEGREFIELNGKRRHMITYLGDFLFSPERARGPAKSLSGGERNRLLLARLFSKPANLLVLDEPTNDLDIETLELLESLLVDYGGTVILISHDRRFLDNVVTSTLAFEGEGRVAEYVGGYEDWLRQGGGFRKPDATAKAADKAPAKQAPKKPAAKPKKLSYHLQRELDTLPERIETLESEIDALQTQISDPAFYEQDYEQTSQTLESLNRLQSELEQAMERWAELESQAG